MGRVDATGWVVAFAVLVFVAYSFVDPDNETEPPSAPSSSQTVRPAEGVSRNARVLRVVDGDTIIVRSVSEAGGEAVGKPRRVRYIGRLSRVSRNGGEGSAVTAIDTVSRVVDGDTVVLRGVGMTRLIGVDTPEVFGHAECFGAQASAFTKRLLPSGTKVRLWSDVEPQDRYGRILLYLQLLDGRFVNDLLASYGMAVPLTIPPNIHRADHFKALSAKARDMQRGLWSPGTCHGNPDLPSGKSNR